MNIEVRPRPGEPTAVDFFAGGEKLDNIRAERIWRLAEQLTVRAVVVYSKPPSPPAAAAAAPAADSPPAPEGEPAGSGPRPATAERTSGRGRKAREQRGGEAA